MRLLPLLTIGSCLLLAAPQAPAQAVNTSQQVTLEGLLTSANHGNVTAASYAPDGSLILLLDEHDGISLLRTNPTATTLLAQSHQGATGDSALAMALDPSGNIYITGTTTSGTLAATSSAAFPAPTGNTTNSFLAKYDANLNPIFLTFVGAGETASSGIAATSDSVFVTGITFSAAFPVTPSGIQQTPAIGSTENGFVERFNTTGTALTYATYLTGASGNTIPTGIAADASDNAYITGATSSTGFPTIAALIPDILGATSGFLTALSPTGSSFLYSTFIPGTGLTSIALDPSTETLLLTGNISPGQFPIATVTTPLVSTPYQSILRLPLNGQSVTSSTLLVPGTQSFATPGPNSTVWISGALTTPLFPGAPAPDYPSGDSFLLHLTTNNTIDQTLRFGGLPTTNPGYASLTSIVAAPAVAANGTSIALPGEITAAVDSSLLTTQRFDLPFVQTPNSVLPNTLADVLPSTCTDSSQCTGTAGLLALVNTATSAPTLSFSANDLPNVTLRNLGSAAATGLTLAVSGSMASNCGPTLEPSNSCTVALTVSGPGIITASASNTTSYALTLPANTLTPDPITLSTDELDFGIVTSTSPAATQTITVTNLTATPQTFTSAIDGSPTTPYTFAETATTCGSIASHTIAANTTCTITIAFTASNAADTPASTFWKIGPRDIKLTAFSQAASLNLSASEVDFGTQFSNTPTLNLPRYLYLSNNSTTPIAHTSASLPATSPFILTDNCPTTLEPHSICSITLNYASTIVPSNDSITLTLDDNLTVLITGQTFAPTAVTGSATNPSLTVSTTAVTFATPVTVTAISGTTQTVTVTNSGAIPFALTAALTGDFLLTNACPATLPSNASCQLILNFAPSQPGQRDGLLSLTAGSNFAPTLISLTGTAADILPANNGTLALGQTYAGEPAIAWYPIQQSLPALTAATNSPLFNVILIPNIGNAPTTLPQSSFTATTTSSCTSCYLGIQFLSQIAGPQTAALTLSTVSGGNPYLLTLTGTSLPVQGLLLTPITQDFGPVPVNSTSAAQTFTLANLLPASTSTTITSITTTGDFSVAPNTTGGPACTAILTPTTSCYIQITFAPTATGDRTGILTLITSSGTLTSTLTGYGAPDPGLSLNPAALTFSPVPNSTATSQTITLTNTGSATLSIATPTTSTQNFLPSSNCITLAPAATCTITVQFSAAPAPITDTLTIPVTSTQNGQSDANLFTLPLTGAYTAQDAGLQILPTQVNFGSTPTGTQGYTRQFTLTNLTNKQVAVTLSMPRQFPLADGSACAILAPSASCIFSVSFLPSTNGALTGTVFAQGTPTDGSAPVQSLAYMLAYGSSTGALTLTGSNIIPNSALSFGQLTSGQTAQQILTLANSGTTPVTIHRITSEPPFLSTTTCGATLFPNATCAVTLTYAPINELSTGTTSSLPRNDVGTLILESDAASSPNTLDLTGTAVPILSNSPASSSVLATFQLSQSSLTFPNTTIGNASPTQTVTLTNTGTSTLHVLSILPSADFTATTNCTTVAPGSTCNLTAQFTPTTASTATLRAGTLEIQSDFATSLEFLTLVGVSSAAPITLNPTALDFGTVNVASTGQLSVTVTNNTAAPITFLGVTATGDYATTRNPCPPNGSTLAAAATCTLNVTFTPTASGTRTGTLSLTTDATTLPLTVSLTGTGALAQLQITPGALAFGNIDVTSPAPHTLTLLNNGSAPVAGINTAITGPNAADFAVTSPCSTTTLAPNQGCTATVTFTPSATGTRTATLAITSSDPNSPTIVPLTGTGIQAGSFTLTVGGAASQTLTVATGVPAVYALTLTPTNGFTGTVALTCAPIISAQYASCSLLSSTLTTTGAVQNSTATVNTLTEVAAATTVLKFFAILFAPILLISRRRTHINRLLRPLAVLLFALSGFIVAAISGCGSGSTPAGASNLRYTPAGTYQYQVTASSTSGAVISSTVTLNLVIQ